MHGCMDDLKTERSFDLHPTESFMCLVYFLHVIYESVYNQTLHAGRRPVDWGRNYISVLYN